MLTEKSHIDILSDLSCSSVLVIKRAIPKFSSGPKVSKKGWTSGWWLNLEPEASKKKGLVQSITSCN